MSLISNAITVQKRHVFSVLISRTSGSGFLLPLASRDRNFECNFCPPYGRRPLPGYFLPTSRPETFPLSFERNNNNLVSMVKRN